MSWTVSGGDVRLLEQSTDLGIDVRAGTLPQLFDMAALATMAVQCLPLPATAGAARATDLRARLEVLGPRVPSRQLALSGHDSGMLLVHWLRELSYLLETEGFLYTGTRFLEVGPGLGAMVSGVRCRLPLVREVKGVTYHELVVSLVGDEWRARISYDL